MKLIPIFILALLLPLESGWACRASQPPSMAERIAVIDVGFKVAKIAMAPDGSGMALAGRNGEAAVVRFSDVAVRKGSTDVKNPTSLLYAPDLSEVWVSARGGAFGRLDPATAGRLGGDVLWDTRAAGLRISSPVLGRYVVADAQKHVEVAGRIVLSNGRLDIGGAVLVAVGPDQIVPFRAGKLAVPVQPKSAPVGAMGEACGGQCILTAHNAKGPESYLWTLKPFNPIPHKLPGTPFLDDRKLATNCTGNSVLLLADGYLRRVALPLGSSPDGVARPLDVAHAKLSADGRYALVMDPNEGWRVFEAQTMSPLPSPHWLGLHADNAVISADAAYAVYADRSRGARLVATPYREIHRFKRGLEGLYPAFSTTGTAVAITTEEGIQLLRSADGAEIAKLPGRQIMFAPGDQHLITLGDTIGLYRLSPGR